MPAMEDAGEYHNAAEVIRTGCGVRPLNWPFGAVHGAEAFVSLSGRSDNMMASSYLHLASAACDNADHVR